MKQNTSLMRLCAGRGLPASVGRPPAVPGGKLYYGKSLKVTLHFTGHAHCQLVGCGVSGHASWKGPQSEAAEEIGLAVTWSHWFAVCAPQNSAVVRKSFLGLSEIGMEATSVCQAEHFTFLCFTLTGGVWSHLEKGSAAYTRLEKPSNHLSRRA